VSLKEIKEIVLESFKGFKNLKGGVFSLFNQA
jgi:hypothetical protein